MEINVVLVTGTIRLPRRTGQAESVPRCESRLLAIDLESHRQYLLGNSQLLHCCLWARIVGPDAVGATLLRSIDDSIARGGSARSPFH